jgi:hypothetical protein
MRATRVVSLALVGGCRPAPPWPAVRRPGRTIDPLLVAMSAVLKVTVAPIPDRRHHCHRAPETPAELVELAHSPYAGWGRTMWKIRFPHALPQIFVGLKTAVAGRDRGGDRPEAVELSAGAKQWN